MCHIHRFAPAWAVLCAPALVLALASCETRVVAPVTDACDAETAPARTVVSLLPGEAVDLPRESLYCLEFSGGPSEYVLGYLDRAFLGEGRGALPGSGPRPFTVAIGSTDRPTAASSSPPTAAQAAHAPPVTIRLDPGPEIAALRAQGNLPHQRDRPWQVGEESRIWSPLKEEIRTIRVEQIHDGYLVFASIVGDEIPTLDWTLAQIDSARTILSETGLSLLGEAFPGLRPLTSEGAGQILILIHPELREERGAAGVMYGLLEDETVRPVLMITPNDPESRRTPVSLGDLILHELAHAFQYRYFHELHGHFPGGATWAVEGGAALFQTEFSRLLAGIGVMDNYDWRNPSGDVASVRFGQLVIPGSGRLELGYDRTASFLQDQLRRRMLAGEPYADALREVSQGALHGWWGHPSEDLAYRQRALLGEAWTREDAVLTWILSHAADDLTDSPVYQNGTVLNAWDTREGEWGWREETVLITGRNRGYGRENEVGDAGFFRLAVPGATGVVGVTSTTDRVAWRILRVR